MMMMMMMSPPSGVQLLSSLYPWGKARAPAGTHRPGPGEKPGETRRGAEAPPGDPRAGPAGTTTDGRTPGRPPPAERDQGPRPLPYQDCLYSTAVCFVHAKAPPAPTQADHMLSGSRTARRPWAVSAGEATKRQACTSS